MRCQDARSTIFIFSKSPILRHFLRVISVQIHCKTDALKSGKIVRNPHATYIMGGPYQIDYIEYAARGKIHGMLGLFANYGR